jgi:hypothetical protein
MKLPLISGRFQLPTKNIENNPMQSSVADAGRGQHPHFDTYPADVAQKSRFDTAPMTSGLPR